MASNNVVGCLLLNYRLQQASRSWEKRKELVISLIIISCPNLDLSLVCEWFSQKNNNEAQRVEEAEAMAFILQHQFLHHAEDIIMDKTTEEKSVFFLSFLEDR